MAVQFKTSGTILFKASGSIAMDSDCCCGGVCCEFDPARELYLTIDNFTLDAGEACDPDCTGFSVTSKVNFGGATTTADLTSWLTETCGDDGNVIIAYTLLCSGGDFVLNMTSGGASWIVDNCTDNNIQCYIYLSTTGGVGASGTDQPLGTAVCDPFYIQATVNIELYDSDGVTLCGTGTMRVTITE